MIDCIHIWRTGYKIPQVENMGATLDQFDTVDFSENDLRKLDGFPYLPRLKCLLLNNNRIVYVSHMSAKFDWAQNWFKFEQIAVIQHKISLISFLFSTLNSRLSDSLHECLPNIHTLILTGNNLQELCDLDALTHLTKLETISLLMNPVATKPHYREYMAFR